MKQLIITYKYIVYVCKRTDDWDTKLILIKSFIYTMHIYDVKYRIIDGCYWFYQDTKKALRNTFLNLP